jgi:hypothetical protein
MAYRLLQSSCGQKGRKEIKKGIPQMARKYHPI